MTLEASVKVRAGGGGGSCMRGATGNGGGDGYQPTFYATIERKGGEQKLWDRHPPHSLCKRV